jgi:hypothetical protein
VIRVYSQGTLAASLIARARVRVSDILRAAGLVPVWVICTLEDADARCAAAPHPADFVVRIVPTRPDPASHGCGVALRPRNSTGQFITLFSDCVREGAEQFYVDEAVVLAYTIVHEVGHLLLREGHSFSGIMRARPDALDWQRASRTQLQFTPDEMPLLRSALQDRLASGNSSKR